MVVLGHPKMGTVDVFGAAFHADSVIAHTACPVTVWRGPPGQLPDHRPVILAAECADDCGAALAAFDYAHRVDAPILVLSLLPLIPEPAATDTTTLGKPTGVGASVAAARRAFPDVAVLPPTFPVPNIRRPWRSRPHPLSWSSWPVSTPARALRFRVHGSSTTVIVRS